MSWKSTVWILFSAYSAPCMALMGIPLLFHFFTRRQANENWVSRGTQKQEMRPIVKVSFLIHVVALLTTGSWELKGSQETMRSIVPCTWSFSIFLCRSFSGFTQSAYNRNKVMKLSFSLLPAKTFFSWVLLTVSTWKKDLKGRLAVMCRKFILRNDERLFQVDGSSLWTSHNTMFSFLFKEKVLWESLLMLQVSILNVP